MNISQANHKFWLILEEDLCTHIPCHVKNIFNTLGYGFALTFKSITDAEIDQVEDYVRTELREDLESRFGTDFNDSVRVSFFGKHMTDSTNFSFSSVEKAALKCYVYYVKQIVDDPGINTGLNHFELFRSSMEELPSVRYFGEKNDVNEMEYTTKTHTLLSLLKSTADQNAKREKSGYRFDDKIKYFSTYVRMLAGPLAYETIQNNLNLALPSLSATNRYISEMHGVLVDGVLRCEALAHYLKDRNLPLTVSLSEDATRINGRVQYDSSLNEIVGFVLPIDNETGMPIAYSFPARSCEEIIKHFTSSNAIANFVNVIMAQPLANIRPFCLLLFSSNGKYSAKNVMDRWNFVTSELAKVGIIVLNIASDSDPRYNSAMRKCSGLGYSSDLFGNVEWFGCRSKIKPPFYVQDGIHIATKLRNLFLKTKPFPEKLPFGRKYYIQMQHLEYLLHNFPKDRHQLTATVLNPLDRQNFSSVQRIYDNKVIELLETNVPESKGTIMFLRLLRNIVESYREPDLAPLERIELIWYSLFVLRIWRQFISSEKSLKLGENFLTHNAYTCVEMNAHALVFIILYLKNEKNDSSLFRPELFDSQPCESFFGQIRSLSTTFSTVVNCSVKEIIARINRIHLQNDITLSTDFAFPRMKSTNQLPKQTLHELPSELEIFERIEKSRHNAIRDSIEIGLLEKNAYDRISFACQVSPVTMKTKKISSVKLEENISISSMLLKREAIVLKNYAEKFVGKEISDTLPYVEVYQSDEKRIIIKKTSFCWLLRKDCSKLSSDRLIRVRSDTQEQRKKKFSHRKTKRTNHSSIPTFKINKMKRRIKHFNS